MLSNLKESALYDKIPEGVLDQDVRGVLEAVVGGYQDRICDLRFFTDRVSTLMDPALTPPALNTAVGYAESFTNGGSSLALTLARYAHEIVSVTVSGSTWQETEVLAYAGAQNVFVVSVSTLGRSVLTFGNGIAGNAVPAASAIVVNYLVRDGVTVEIQFTGDQGQIVTRTLDINSSTPPFYAEDALKTWAATEAGIEEARITAVTVGTDVLRQISANTLALLAATVGARLYRNPMLGDGEQVEASRRQLLAWFPRLRIKGTAGSFSVLGRLLGFASSTLLPLWQRLAPRQPQSPGDESNNADFALQPEVFPVPILPDPADFYDPAQTMDGPFYTWTSPPLRPDEAHPDYYLKAISNPYVRPVRLTPVIVPPAPVDFYLDHGSVDRRAYVDLNSTLRVEALTPTPAFNGLRIEVSRVVAYGTYATGAQFVEGTFPQMRIRGRLSRIKYRSSFYDLAMCADADRFDEAYGTPPVSLNDAVYVLRNELAGTCPSTGRPLTEGYSTAYYGVPATSRVSAPPDTPQMRDDLLRSLGRSAVEAAEELRPASRMMRRAYYGFSIEDTVNYAPVSSRVVLTNMTGTTHTTGMIGSGSVPYPVPDPVSDPLYYAGTILQYGSSAHLGTYHTEATTYGYDASFYVEQGAVMSPMQVERVAGSPVLHLSQGTVSGSYNLLTRQYTLTSTVPSPGSIVAYWRQGSTETIRSDPSVTALLPYAGTLFGAYGAYDVQLRSFDWGSYTGSSVLVQIVVNGTIRYVATGTETGTPGLLTYYTSAPSGGLVNALLVKSWGLSPAELAYYQDRPEDRLGIEEGAPVGPGTPFGNPYGSIYGSYHLQEPWVLSWLGLSGSFTNI